jgi:glycosyltransferase involved in cell wall biosynthesis
VKIALACPNFPTEFTGGTERVSLALAKSLQAKGHDLLVIAGSDRLHAGEDILAEEHAGLPIRRLPRNPAEEYGLDLRRPRIQSLIDRLLDEEGLQVLHLQHWATLCTGMLRAARARGITAVATLHDMWTACPRFFRRPPAGFHCPTGAGRDSCVPCADHNLDLGSARVSELIRERDRELQAELAAADAITVPSQASAERIRRHLPWQGDLRIVPHGLLEPVGDERSRPRAGAPLRVGSFGNLVEEKGIAVLPEALAGIHGVELHLYGPFLEASFRDLVEKKAAELGVDLHCHGAWTDGDPHPATSLDLALFPSLCEESYGLVVEEALARGVPVLVSNRGALGERIGDGGRVVSVGRVAHWARAIRDLVENPDKLMELRSGIAEEFFSIDDAAEQYLEIYGKSDRVST